MRLILAVLIGIAVTISWRQHSTLNQLRDQENRLAKNAALFAPGTAEGGKTKEPDTAGPSSPNISDKELARFTDAVASVKNEFETDRWAKLSDENGLSHPELCETLCRLSSAQLRTVIEAWPGDASSGSDRRTGIHRFMLLACRVNPSATLPLLYELRKERGERDVPGSPAMAFQHWFRRDPEGLLKWAREAGMPEGFEDQCATYADAAVVLQSPSAENIKKLIEHKFGWDNWARNELALKMETQEARLNFFRNLHVATNGVYDDLGYFVRCTADRIPFTQLAYVADNTPAFKVSKPEQPDPVGFPAKPLGSFRFEVAASSRDGTAQERWEWLTRREEDRPTGKPFGKLVQAWLTNDYQDTADWVRALPPGNEREAATKEVIQFLQRNGAQTRVAEWKK